MKSPKPLAPIESERVANQEPHAKNCRNIITERRSEVELDGAAVMAVGVAVAERTPAIQTKRLELARMESGHVGAGSKLDFLSEQN
jgi:hypothetical protein